MKKVALFIFILLTYVGYAQNKLYKNNSVVITTTRMTYSDNIVPFVIDTTGNPDYADFSSIENWSLYGRETSLTIQQIKDEIDTLVATKTFAACTDLEKDVASMWFVVDKLDRDTRYNAVQQEQNAERLAIQLLPKSEENKIVKFRDAVKNETADNIRIVVSNLNKSLVWVSPSVSKVDGIPVESYTDIDISSDTKAGIAHTAIFQIKIEKTIADAHRDIMLRANGSTLDSSNVSSLGGNVKTGLHIHGMLIVPLDINEVCEYKINDSTATTVEIILLGYLK